MLVVRPRRRFHLVFSSSACLSTAVSSLQNLFRTDRSGTGGGHQRQRKQGSEKQAFVVFSKWCERCKLPAPVVRDIIQRELKWDHHHSTFSGYAIFYGLLKEGQVIDEDAANVLIEIAESGVFPSVPVQLSHLITKLCVSGFVGKAWDFFHAVKRGGCMIGTSCCNGLLNGLHKNKDFTKMNLLFSEMNDWGLQPDEFTHGILLDHLCKSNRVEDARTLLNKMSMTTPPRSNRVMFNTVISGLCKDGRLEDAMKLISVMTHKCGFAPDTITYTTVINGYCKLGDVNAANKLVARTKSEGVAVRLTTINRLINGMCQNGRIASALDFFREQCSANPQLSRSIVSYNILIGAFLKAQNISKALELFEEIRERGNKPNIITYGIMIPGLTAAGDMSKAYSLVSQMRNEGFHPQIWCYNTLINGFAQKNCPDKMHEVLEEMETAGLKPDVVTYTTLITFSAKKGDIATANQHFNDMVICGCKPTLISYGALINVHCKSGKFNEAMKIFRNMLDSGLQPNNTIYSTIFNHLSNEKNVDYVLTLLDEMRAHGVTADTFTYNTVFRCLYRRNALDNAFELMNTMTKEGCKPDYFTLKILTEWFSSASEIERLKRFMNAFEDNKDSASPA